jgi:hypothetical protein
VAVIAVGVAAPPLAVALTVIAILASIPLTLWLMIKLLLVGPAIIVEHATIGGAIARSWRLIRGRFWAALGVIVLISVVFGGIAQVISFAFSFLTAGLSTIIAPTGDDDTGGIIALVVGVVLSQAIILLIQSVAVVVQSTATALIYIDCRMRREGLDLDLLAYTERRDAGWTGLADPYRENVGRTIAPRPPLYPAPAYPAPAYPAYPANPAYPTGAYPATPPANPAPAAAYPAPAPAYPAPAAPPPTAETAAPHAHPAPPPDRWTPPGAPADRATGEESWS